MKHFLLVLFFCFSYFGITQINSIEDIENPRELNEIWVANPDYIIDNLEVKQIDSKLKEIESETGYEIAVVLVNSINGNIPYDFGLGLFNKWGIGKKQSDNGLLILLVNDIRNITFVTGSGTEIVLSDAMTYEIAESSMKPDFKNGNFSSGILNGLEDIKSIFEGNPMIISTETSNSHVESASTPFYKTSLLVMYFSIVGFFFILYLILVVITLFIKNLHIKYHILKGYNLLIFPILMPIPFAILYFMNKVLMERWRNTNRFSEKNGEIMYKLNDQEEDEFLTDGQLSEEAVKSIDYDVWVTKKQDDIIILKYADWFNKYKKCPSCRHKTYFKEYDKTLRSATYTSSGKGEKKFYCENCGHEDITTYTIPRLRRSSSSGGGSSSSGSFSGGGSSFGGGSSSGGGSSNSW